MLKTLQPRAVWSHFADICAIPHPSMRETALRGHLFSWGRERGLEPRIDPVGNLILRKPASPGCEAMRGVILQGHLDMVCQANSGSQHDFEHDPIRPVVRDGWVTAEQTTLGADNGIGVALALAILEDPDLAHPPLEVLLTVNEESGMDGARGVPPGALQGKILINLDSEEWGCLYIGCAGGMDVEVSRACQVQEVPSDYRMLRFGVAGLRGGHSGIDIHIGRGNAIKLLCEALRDLSLHSEVLLIGINGGTARNAIPREAFATCALPGSIAVSIDDWVRHRQAAMQRCLMDVDPGATFTCEHCEEVPRNGLSRAESSLILAFLDGVPNGVSRISEDFPGVTDTSSNLGVVRMEEGCLRAIFKVRSLDNGRAHALSEKLAAHARAYGLAASGRGSYPAWTPEPSSAFVGLCQRVYAEQFGQPSRLQVIHAGLECGLFAASFPHLDMVSFGPDIRDAHAPGERVDIDSVKRCWQLLRALLQELAKEDGAASVRVPPSRRAGGS